MKLLRWFAKLFKRERRVIVHPVPVPEPDPVPPVSGGSTAGRRNKNPVNVKAKNATYWLGQVGRDDRGHAIFDDDAYGLRAAVVNLRAYWFKHNRRTIAEILERWAPSTDTIGSLPGAPPNSPKDYAEYVSAQAGIHYNETLRLFNDNGTVRDVSQLHALLAAMAKYENDRAYQFARVDFDRALTLI